MKKLLFVLPILFLEGCFFHYNIIKGGIWNERDCVDYSIEISSSDAKDITLYIPFPHYKGKPDMRILKWLREGFAERQEFFGSEKGVKIDLIDTKYGKMLYLYIPEPPRGFTTQKGGVSGGEWREIKKLKKLNPKKVSQDYKLTGEDKVEAETISEKEIHDYPTEEVIGKEICQKINLPIYVQFEGNELKIRFYYSIQKYFENRSDYDLVNFFGSLWDGGGGNLCLLLCYNHDKHLTFTKSGWQVFPIEKTITKDPVLEKW